MVNKKNEPSEQEILEAFNSVLRDSLDREQLNLRNVTELLMRKLDPSQSTAIAASVTLAKLWDIAEPNAKRGEKILASAKAGHLAVYGDEEIKERKKREIIETCIEISKVNSHLSLTSIRTKAAQKLGVSFKTVQRATPRLKEILGK
jgi:hypothetical protein